MSQTRANAGVLGMVLLLFAATPGTRLGAAPPAANQPGFESPLEVGRAVVRAPGG